MHGAWCLWFFLSYIHCTQYVVQNWTIQYSSHSIRNLSQLLVCTRARPRIVYVFQFFFPFDIFFYSFAYLCWKCQPFRCLNMDYELVCTCACGHTLALMKTHYLISFLVNANGNLCVFRMHKLLWFSLWHSTHYSRVRTHLFYECFNCILTRTDFYFILFPSSSSFTLKKVKFKDIFGNRGRERAQKEAIIVFFLNGRGLRGNAIYVQWKLMSATSIHSFTCSLTPSFDWTNSTALVAAWLSRLSACVWINVTKCTLHTIIISVLLAIIE